MSVKPLNNQVYFSGGPVDGRTVVATEANITSISNAYVGMGVTVLNNGSPKKYTIKKLTILGKPDTKANGGYEEDIDTIGAASKESVNIIADKLNKLPSGMYYGQYSSVENLPAIGTLEQKGYAYVSSVEPNVYYIYLYNGDGEEWQDSGNKFVTTELETNLSTKSQTKAPTTKAVQDGIDAIDVTKMQNVQPVVAALNNRVANVDQQTSEVKALGYKVLNPSLSFVEQVTVANTVYEIRNFFDISGTEQEPATVTIPINCKLRFEGGMLGGEYCTLQGNNTLIESDSACIQKGITIAGSWANDTIYTKWLELISVDDEYIEVEDVQQLNPNPTNNYLQFKQLECLINGTNGCKVEFEEGYYQCRFPDPYTSPEGTREIDGVTYQMFSPFIQYHRKSQTYIYIDSLPYVDINLNGATLKSLQHGYPRWSWIVISNCKKSALHDGIIIGFAAQFDYPQYCNHSRANNVDTYVVSRDYQVGDLVRYHSIECSAYNLTIGNTTGDAMCCGSNTMYSYSNGSPTLIPVYCNSYKVSNCEFSYCGRNGISLHSSNYSTLESLHIHHIGSDGGDGVIGSDGVMGQDPRSGIDFEFEDDLGLNPITFWNNLHIHDCGLKVFGFASISRSTTKSFIAKNSVFDGVCYTMVYKSVIPVFEDCKFIVSSSWTGFAGKSQYINCDFDVKALMTFGRNTFTNCRFIDNITKEPWGSDDHLYDVVQTNDLTANFEKCYFLIKHKSTFVHKNFKECEIYIDKYKNDISKTCVIYAGGSYFHGCKIEALHSTIQDNVSVLDTYNVSFGNKNNSEKTFFFNCEFINIKGTNNSTPAFYNAYGYTFENCQGDLMIRTGESDTTKVGDVTIKKCNGESLNIKGIYAQPTTKFSIIDSKFTKMSTDTAMKTYPENYIIDNCDIGVKDLNYFKKFTINNSKITFPYTNSNLTDYLSGIIVNNSDVTFVNSITTAAVGMITLNECTVRGAVHQRLYQGEANDCKFVNDANSGTSAQKPPYNLVTGQKYFDTTRGKPIFWNGASWIDGNGDFIFDNSGTLNNRKALNPTRGQQFKLTGGDNDVYLIYGAYGWLNCTDGTPFYDDSGKLNAMYDKYNYTLLTSQPTDWQTKYNTYYKIVDGVYTKLTELETWATDTYYKLDVNAYKGIQVKLTDTDTELLDKVVKWNGTKYINVVDNVALKAGTPTVTFTTENNATTATITSTSSGKIYYTKNGDAPTSSSTEYSSAITLVDGDQVKAICIRDHMDNSNIGYVPVAKPVITFNDGILHIECDTPDAKIYYTTDGNPPSTSSTEYDSSASVTIAKGVTVKAFAILIGLVNSTVASKKRS